MSVVLAELYGGINQARELARQVERHIAQRSQPYRDELRAWRSAFDNLADLLQGVTNEFERIHGQTK